MKQKASVIFCRCGAGISDEAYVDISKELNMLDIDVFELHDLCAFSVNEKEFLNALGSRYQKKIVLACYPRAVKNMFIQGGVDMGSFDVLNFKELSAREILEALKTEHYIPAGVAQYQTKKSELKVPAWFPVIDESLCSLCGKCARFCLFGVYSYNKKSLKVVDPLACKNNCPACGRTCPTSAIMFPRLNENTVLAGAEPGSKHKKPGDGGLMMLLNDRNRDRKNIFRQGVMQQAEEERQKAIEELRAIMAKKNS